jgi:ketosteroid isomerase-like protein
MLSPLDDDLHAAELALRAAQLAGDADRLERLLDDGLFFTGPDGQIYTKAQDLDAHRNGWIRITRLEPSEEHVARFGEMGVVSVRMEMAGEFQGQAFAGAYRYTRIWRWANGEWRVVAGHVSAVAPGG